MRPSLALLLLGLLAVGTNAAEPRIVGYFAEWGIYGRKYNVGDIPADKLTHINYAFAKIANGECVLVDSYAAIDKAYPGDTWDNGVLRGSFNQLRKLKTKYPHLKTLISVGGWTLSGSFSDVALTEASREVRQVVRRLHDEVRLRRYRHRLGISRRRRTGEQQDRAPPTRRITLCFWPLCARIWTHAAKRTRSTTC